MKDIENKEKVSMLMDNHWERFEQDSIIKELNSDSNLQSVWSRYHLIGDILRGCKPCQSSICASVMEKLKDEPTVLAPRWRVPKVNKWVKEVGIGSAVAAAILLAIILLPIGPQNDVEQPVVATINPIQSNPKVNNASNTPIPVMSDSFATRSRQVMPMRRDSMQNQLVQGGGGGGIPELEQLIKAHNTTTPRGFSGHMRTARTASLVVNKTSVNP